MLMPCDCSASRRDTRTARALCLIWVSHPGARGRGKSWLISGPYLRASRLGARGQAARAPYALSGPCTAARAESATAGLSPGLPTGRADKRRIRLISPPGFGKRRGRRDTSPAQIGEPLSAPHPSLRARSARFGRGGPRAGAKRRARTGGGHHPSRLCPAGHTTLTELLADPREQETRGQAACAR
jgi:hypothetical protein